MRVLVVGFFMVLLAHLAAAQGSITVWQLGNYKLPIQQWRLNTNPKDTSTVDVAFAKPAFLSGMFMAQPYVFKQGKLPLFCAMEDKLWRRTGMGIQLRLTDAPVGF